MLISNDSALRQLPIGLDDRQAAYLDGLRLSFEMVEIAYSRLVISLENLKVEPGRSQHGPYDFASIFLDAWSIVDGLYRIRQLVDGMPGLSKQGETMQTFVRQIKKVEKYRHIIQHLRGEIEDIVQDSRTTWGTLLYLQRLDSHLLTVTLIPGRIAKGSFEIINPVGKAVSTTISEITLCVYKANQINLSDQYLHLTTFIKSMEKSCATEWGDNPLAGSDLTIAARIGE